MESGSIYSPNKPLHISNTYNLKILSLAEQKIYHDEKDDYNNQFIYSHF